MRFHQISAVTMKEQWEKETRLIVDKRCGFMIPVRTGHSCFIHHRLCMDTDKPVCKLIPLFSPVATGLIGVFHKRLVASIKLMNGHTRIQACLSYVVVSDDRVVGRDYKEPSRSSGASKMQTEPTTSLIICCS